MTINVTLNNISNLQDTTTAQTNINANSAAISGGFSTALNVTGDQMKGNLDMNSNQILNLPAPATANSPVRLQDVTSSSSIASVPPVGTSGAVVPLLNGNNTFSGTNSFNSVSISTITNTVKTNNLYVNGPDPWADIRAYGAVGDNVTDDTVAIQAAMSSLTSSNGGVCYIPPGTFRVNGTLNVPQSVSVLGVGNQSFINANQSTTTVFNIAVGTSQTFFEKLNISGNLTTSVSSPVFNVPAGTANISFRDIYSQGHGVAMNLAANACVIDSCFLMGNTGAVIVTGDNWFHGCTLDPASTTTQQYSVLINGPVETHFSQCDMSGHFSNASFVMSDSTAQARVTLSQCVFGNIGSTSSTSIAINAGGGKWLSTHACEYGGNVNATSAIVVNTSSSPLLSVVGCWAQTPFTTPANTVQATIKTGNFNIT